MSKIISFGFAQKGMAVMRKVDVVRPPINYVVFGPNYKHQIAWFVDADDAQDFVNSQFEPEKYEIAEVRK